MFFFVYFYNFSILIAICVILLHNLYFLQDEDAFFADYAEAHLKLSELGYV